MPIKYTVVDRKNPIKPTDPAKYYASVKISGHIDLRELAEYICDMTCLDSVDAMAAIEALLKVIPRELAKGKVVNLGDFGSYRLSLHSRGEADGKDVSNASIIVAKPHFRPGRLFRETLKATSYRREVTTP